LAGTWSASVDLISTEALFICSVLNGWKKILKKYLTKLMFLVYSTMLMEIIELRRSNENYI